MTRLRQPFTMGTWSAMPGKEEAFASEWKRFADWTAKSQPGAGTGYLLQDPMQPQRFVSFGAWESTEAIQAWRNCPEFTAFVSAVKGLCEEFTPHTFVLVASSNQRREPN